MIAIRGSLIILDTYNIIFLIGVWVIITFFNKKLYISIKYIYSLDAIYIYLRDVFIIYEHI